MTVIKAKSGYIFRGFTEKEWHLKGCWVTDPETFIFSLVNKEDNPFKVLCSNEGKYAIYCDSEFGPCFGGDDDYDVRDISIDNDSNINKESYCDFGNAV